MRRAPTVRLRPDQRQELRELAEGPATPRRVALRSRVVLRAGQGASNDAIAHELGISAATTAKWRRRFLSSGITGIARDAPRSGRPPTVTEETVRAILRATVDARAARLPGASSRTLAETFRIGRSTVQRIWSTHGVAGHDRRRGRASRGTEFLERVTDVVGLYLNPPARAIAFSTDERLAMNPFRLASGAGLLRRPAPDRGTEFRAFLQMTERETPKILDVHLLVDSRLGPMPAEVERWLRHHPRFHLHRLPTDRVGSTLIDRLIDGFSHRRDRPGASASAHRLKNALREHIRLDRDSARPFVWTAASGDIRGAFGRSAIQQ